ncbi:hypothetical protein [Saccharibacillus sp. JS10]|uniref:hypothetical protein n=1 Tax=Saccharibacillus sp. JS10 TaxID=2950552 RepID=UPI00210DC5B5|nr:hypothetical protein [Saccharibacillus sp. JS10]MCQ4085948.1 hypothetical protein [Saccharibacillus sp. JS10]
MNIYEQGLIINPFINHVLEEQFGFRLRQQVLEGLGWKIYRIWSQEWFKNCRHEVERLKLYLEEETDREIYLGI